LVKDIPKLLIDSHFNSVEEFVLKVDLWDIEFIQLDPGLVNARVFQLGLGEVMIGRYSFDRKFHQLGASPKGVRTFGIVNPPGVSWCGRMADENSILLFPTSGDYESLSDPGFSAVTISISEHRLNALSESIGLPTIEKKFGSGEAVIRCEPGLVQMLRSSIDSICNTVSGAPTLLGRPSLYSELNHELPVQLLTALSIGREIPLATSKRRMDAMRKAKEFMEESKGDISIEDVCRVSGVSWRTLDYSFKEHIGLGPKKYLDAFRLNRAHQELYQSSARVKISDVANNWGYWHIGRFAGNYKRFFGELPSETVIRRNHNG
jgi:AraC family ethanolamine operon transcriptional activator